MHALIGKYYNLRKTSSWTIKQEADHAVTLTTKN